jgi:peptidase E
LPKPIYAFADSIPLFGRTKEGAPFLQEIKQHFSASQLTAAYVGASNHDDLEIYHSIFVPVMQQIGITECDMILTRPTAENGRFLERADIILLAGGDVEVGWSAFEKNGLKELLVRRFHENTAVLIGVSAGAVQLGYGSLTDNGSKLLSTFGLLPFYVGAHEESENWNSLRKAVQDASAKKTYGIGIPSGGGLFYDDTTREIRPISKSLFEITAENGQVHEALFFPETLVKSNT